AEAMAEQYLPRFAGDTLPKGYIGQILSVADKIDTLCGIFSIGQKPTGTKDPFGLRRAALGVLRIIIEAKLTLDLREVLVFAAQKLSVKVDANAQLAKTEQYIFERLRAYYQEAEIAADSVETVARIVITQPLDFDQRVRAVNRFRHLPEAESLAAANKRIANLLKKVEGDIPATVNPNLFVETQETALYEALQTQEQSVANFAKNADYEQGLRALAQLKPQVDAFFDHVMVMADDERLKNNRLALLKQLRQQFLQIADVSYLQC
ncbi:MAG TPA: glycine--tRNA ligase subunit beta, partial [Thiothrix sp.]|nr:glycine--tRNA ligase subunit beta [Thiothrix sp.]